VRKPLESLIQELCNEFDQTDWSDKRVYAAYCSQLYYYVRQSTRVIALAAGRLSLEDQKAHERFAKHIQEEKNHELLALRDCQALGYDVHDFPELESTRAFYRMQFYNAIAVTPWAFLGYTLVLEGLAVKKAMDLHRTVTKHHGPKCGSFLKVHGEEDEDHFPEALKLVEGRSDSERAAILDSAEMSVYLHRMMLKDLPRAIAMMEKKRGGRAA
jgi:pyrroloquinoline quinone (PQQ) biosynthesis protein C